MKEDKAEKDKIEEITSIAEEAAEEQKEWLVKIASAETGRMPDADELTDPLSDFWSKGLRHLPPSSLSQYTATQLT